MAMSFLKTFLVRKSVMDWEPDQENLLMVWI